MYQHKRGKIKESVIKALVTDPLFTSKIEKPKKGKGSYTRKNNKKSEGWEV